jgi:hypothetical protein
MDNKILFVLAIVLLSGCVGTSSGLDYRNAVNESTAVESVELQTNNQNPRINLQINDVVQKNNEQCHSVYNPALKITETRCNDNWDNVTITGVHIVTNESTYNQFNDVTNGDEISLEIPRNSSTYEFYFESETGEDTYFQTEIMANETSLKINSAGYSNKY